jgi:IS1 family transposase
MWSFVGSKENKQWNWLAMGVNSREIVGGYTSATVADNRQREIRLSLLGVYRQGTVCYTDFWEAYE